MSRCSGRSGSRRWISRPLPEVRSELELLLSIALEHDTCATEKPRIDGDAVVIPFDLHRPGLQPEWTIGYERVRNRGELLEALGYG